LARRGFPIALRRIDPVVAIGVLLIVSLIAVAYAVPYSAAADANVQRESFAAPGKYWFGTDTLGRDVFRRVLAGARLDLPLALGGMAVSLVLGVPLGLLVSQKSRWSERFMRGLDMFQAFPLLVIAIVLVALAGNHLYMVIVAIAVINTPRFIRLIRSEALSLRESRFVEAAVSIGASRTRVMFNHILPSTTGTILVQASLTAAQSIVVIAALAYLGVGIRPPKASWGAMIKDGSQGMTTGQWWIAIFPGIAVFACVLLFNLIGDRLEKTLSRGARG
jgi:peptide/nickel transport system permease protein